MPKKIDEKKVKAANIDIFGSWFSEGVRIETMPFNHVIIDNFFQDDEFVSVQQQWPRTPGKDWFEYKNPIEFKYVYEEINEMPASIKNVFYALSNRALVDKFSSIFNIPQLQADPYCQGGGLHMAPKNGRLMMHLDYEVHAHLEAQRRLNIIIYINEKWEDAWKGETQLWDSDLLNCVKSVYPKRNRALAFVTTELSWHGVPEPIRCPDDVFRSTLNFYYISPIINQADISKHGSDEKGFRRKAVFCQRPGDPFDERMNKLLKLRPHQRITQETLQQIWPEWSTEN